MRLGGETFQIMSDADFRVSVVVPTVNRPIESVRAVLSALRQDPPPAEVVVVVDGPDDDSVEALSAIADARVRIFRNDASKGASAARNRGIFEARYPWVALLDDDDEWLPGKLAVHLGQLRRSGSSASNTVFATAAEWHGEDGVHVWPTRKKREDESVADYLFVRTKPGEGLLATPTLLVARDLALAVPFDARHSLHEDYEWLMRLEVHGARFDVALDAVVKVNAPRLRQSASTSVTWRDSLAWALLNSGKLGDRAFAAFCLTEVARRARLTRDARTFVALIAIANLGRPRVLDLLRYLLVWVLPEAGRRGLWRNLQRYVERPKRVANFIRRLGPRRG
jgi:glycosyltransferase involved in cell wall biosynthesis